MKMFRRISALALVAVMICLFSASAFAANYFSGCETYDSENVIEAYAVIDQISTDANLTITNAPGLGSDYYLSITCIYDYTKHNEFGTFSKVGYGEYDEEAYWGRSVFSVSTSDNPTLYKEFKKAVYRFYGEFTPMGVTYTYNPASATIMP